jgi:ribA/ribD-fused uncharacterized protein
MAWYFSNFHELEEPIVYGDLRFFSVEAFFQAMKTHDRIERYAISRMKPREAKDAGRMVKLREDWEEIKLDVMEYGLRKRFKMGTLDAGLLMDLEGEIVEWTTGWHDTVWGKCKCNAHKGQGKNLLGILLMKIRDDLNHG